VEEIYRLLVGLAYFILAFIVFAYSLNKVAGFYRDSARLSYFFYKMELSRILWRPWRPGRRLLDVLERILGLLRLLYELKKASAPGVVDVVATTSAFALATAAAVPGWADVPLRILDILAQFLRKQGLI